MKLTNAWDMRRIDKTMISAKAWGLCLKMYCIVCLLVSSYFLFSAATHCESRALNLVWNKSYDIYQNIYDKHELSKFPVFLYLFIKARERQEISENQALNW